MIEHVGIVSEIDQDGNPYKVVHAPGSGSKICANGLACEFDLSKNTYMQTHIAGHGRMGKPATQSVAATHMANAESRQLRIEIESPSQTALQIYVFDASGHRMERVLDPNLMVTTPTSAFTDPYLENANYENTSTGQSITIDEPAIGDYRVELVGDASVSYTLRLQVLEGAVLLSQQEYEGTLEQGARWAVHVTLSAEGVVAASAPLQVASLALPDWIVAASGINTFTITETTGFSEVTHLELQASDFRTATIDGEPLRQDATLIQFIAPPTTVPPSGTQTITFTASPSLPTRSESYYGILILRSDTGGVYRLPIKLVPRESSFALFLPGLQRAFP